MKIVVVNGRPRSGKDSFVDFALEVLMKRGLRGVKISSVDAVKAAGILGWDLVKDEKGRQFLSDLKDASTRLYDGPMRYIKERMEESGADVAFLFIREPEEIDRFKAAYPEAKTVLLCRDCAESFENHADARVGEYRYDFYLANNKGLGSLRDLAQVFVCLLYEGRVAATPDAGPGTRRL